MVNILIADDNINYAISLMNIINKQNTNIRVCNIAQDGKQTVEILNNENNIDVILLDFKMPIYDGGQVLDKIKNKSQYENSCIIISGEIDLVKNLNTNKIVSSIIYKTSSINSIMKEINRIVELKEKVKKNKELKNKIIKELLYLEYNISHKGTQYLIKTIEYIALNPNKDLEKLERSVYPRISTIYNDSIHNIKCNINRATTSMYCECEIEKLRSYFQFDKDTKPKVKTVIHTIINKIL